MLPPSPGFFRRLQHELQNPRGPASVVNEPDSDSESDNDTPSRRRPRIRFRRENDKTATELCSYAVVWWVILGVALAMDIGGGVSRRVVSLQPISSFHPLIRTYRSTFHMLRGSAPSIPQSSLVTCCSISSFFHHHYRSRSTPPLPSLKYSLIRRYLITEDVIIVAGTILRQQLHSLKLSTRTAWYFSYWYVRAHIANNSSISDIQQTCSAHCLSI